MYLCRCNFLSVTPLPSHRLLHIAKRLTHAQSQFPVTNLTPFIGYNTGWAEYIIMRALTFIIKSLFVPAWSPGNCAFQPEDITDERQYLHFSGYESRQLRQEEEEYEDTAEDGNCGQRGRKSE